jgi:hypothetical protein
MKTLRVVVGIVVLFAMMLGFLRLMNDDFFWKTSYRFFQTDWFGSQRTKVISKTVAYRFDDITFQVTVDSGHSWKYWKLPRGGLGGDHAFYIAIEAAQINKNGQGYIFSPGDPDGSDMCYTTADFGVTWKSVSYYDGCSNRK